MSVLTRFQRWALLTTLATYLVIVAGGLVRASGAGLGCPDWPQCFGRPYPPLTQSQVPTDAGFDPAEFNFQLAWTEYLNRFVGVVVGLLIIGTLYYAWKDHRHNKRILYPSIGAFVFVVLQGGLGGALVQSELDPLILTAHLLMAFVIVALLLYATISGFYPDRKPFDNLPRPRRRLATITLVILGLSLVQAVIGTFLRTEVDRVEEEYPHLARGEWLAETGWIDPVHRTYSWILLFGVAFLIYYAHRRVDTNRWLQISSRAVGGLVLAQILAGIVLAYGDYPPAFQAIHMVVGSLYLGALMVVYLLSGRVPVEVAGESQPSPPPLKAEQTPIPHRS
jgi:cytochrome c oxidase assembly protein subunit 15